MQNSLSAVDVLTCQLPAGAPESCADSYHRKKPAIKEKSVARSVAAQDDEGEPVTAASSDPYAARPAKRPGVVSCNTRCINAACWRTYDSGKKVRFQAQHKYDALSGEWKFDSGPC